MKKSIMKKIYIVFFLLMLAVPGVVTVFAPSEAVGNEEKAELNDINYMNAADKFDDWFSQSFGLRNKLLGLNNGVRYSMFGQSGQDSVIAGDDGWLFYESALHDYTGEDVMSDSDIEKTAKILELAQEYAESRGSRFVFASAPNKMEIYGEHMPYYCVESETPGNYEKLMEALERFDVCHADLKAVLKKKAYESSINIYHKLDSHWNNMGAAEALNAICDVAGYDNSDYTSLDYSVQKNFDGDLYKMLFPDGKKKDDQVVFDSEQDFQYTSRFMGNDDLVIDTENPDGSGTVKMFRDSFGNALHWFFANEFEKAHFTREIPYNLSDCGDYDYTVVEIVERNIGNILKYPPVMPAAEYECTKDIAESEKTAVMETETSGDYTKVSIRSGVIPDDCTDIYLELSGGSTYSMFPQSGDYSAVCYVSDLSDISGVVFCCNNKYYRAGLLEN